MVSPWLRRKAAAAYLGISEDRLAAFASRGGGPRFHRPSGSRFVLYRVEDLDAWCGAPVRSATEADARDRELAGVA